MSTDNSSPLDPKIDKKPPHETELYVPVEETKWPIVYHPEYNIGFLGLEKLHPFDAGKWGRIFNFLKEDRMLRDDSVVRPKEATEQDLLVVHKKPYLESLKWSLTVAGITEVPPVAILPNFIVQRKVLKPFRYHTGGTILAAKLAMERGWGINIGGGFHHCSSDRGGGFCAYADITLAILFLFQRNPKVTKAMIIDLDAHQGNGHERDFMNDDRVYIMDVYNRGIYPHDGFAKRLADLRIREWQEVGCFRWRNMWPGHKNHMVTPNQVPMWSDYLYGVQMAWDTYGTRRAIKRKVELEHGTNDAVYLHLVETNIEGALNEFQPDIIVYNAGTDILEGDPLGCLSVTPQGIIQRDEIVFEKAIKRGIPVLMVTSGGYQKTTARIIADSILNLKKKGLISCEAAENCQPSPKESSIRHSLSDGKLFSWIPFMSRSSTQEFPSTDSITSQEKTTISTPGVSNLPGGGKNS